MTQGKPGLGWRLVRQVESPPTWLLGFVVLAVIQARHLPVWPASGLTKALALAAIAAGLAVFVAAALSFRAARTTILPRETPSQLITKGVYAHSRNPIYLADAVLLAGVALWLDLGGLALVPAFMAVIWLRFIRGEEAGCARAFAADWDAYAAKVRRWL